MSDTTVPNASPEMQLDSLVSLIASSVEQVKLVYKQAGLPAPSLGSNSSDISQTTDLDAQAKVERATKVIVAACAQLTTSILPPQRSVLNMAYAFEDSATIHAIARGNIAEALLSKPDGLHVNELSKISGIDADKLGRILRFLAIKHIFREVSPNVFANNKVSDLLATPSANALAVNTAITAKAAFRLGDWLVHHDSEKGVKSPFQLAYGSTLMDYHNTPEGKATVPTFMKAVATWGEYTGKVESMRVFPWSKYFSGPNQAVVCDVGAGDGHATLTLMKMHESYDFRVVIQDRPAFLELSKKLWQKELPRAIDEGKVNFVQIDFFKEPPVPECDIYYIRHCIHNWPDDKCIIILMNIAQSMRSKPGSILLIHDIVLLHATEHTEKTAREALTDESIAPAPLLPNFGAAAHTQYVSDITMLNLLDAKERTLDELIFLGSEAGFEFEQMWYAGQTSILQFKLL